MARVQEALGRIELRQTSSAQELRHAEFRVFSQWGEDGIIQRLVRDVRIERKVFVEFGVQDYTEASTRFLLVNDGWSGLVIDGSPENIDSVRRDEIYWRHHLKAECAFVTRENINNLLESAGLKDDIGLLSIDIDGNDYWVWESIKAISPRIVVVEYNSRFGPSRAVTIPYSPSFTRQQAHYSMIYYGASLLALEILAKRKGYALVGCNAAGNNAFFVREDCLPPSIKQQSSAEAYVESSFREARNELGELQFLSAEQEQILLQALPLVDVSS